MFKWFKDIRFSRQNVKEIIPSHLKKYRYISSRHDMYHFQFDYSSTSLPLEKIIKLAENLCMNPAIKGKNIVLEVEFNFEHVKTEKQEQVVRIQAFACCLGMEERIEFEESKTKN